MWPPVSRGGDVGLAQGHPARVTGQGPGPRPPSPTPRLSLLRGSGEPGGQCRIRPWRCIPLETERGLALPLGFHSLATRIGKNVRELVSIWCLSRGLSLWALCPPPPGESPIMSSWTVTRCPGSLPVPVCPCAIWNHPDSSETRARGQQQHREQSRGQRAEAESDPT